MFQKLYDSSPVVIQNLMVTASNHLSIRKRRSRRYKDLRRFYEESEFLPRNQLLEMQRERLEEFLLHCQVNSPWHHERLSGFDLRGMTVERLSELPMMSKEDLRSNTKRLATISKDIAYISKTGGTTGAALQVLFTWEDFQDRTAFLEFFRERFAKVVGAKTAWFSGKSLIPNPAKEKTFSRYNFIDRIRYYSTFHTNFENAEKYLRDMERFQPEVLVGFPSSMLELVRFAESTGRQFNIQPKAIFPTAETLTPHIRASISEFFAAPVYDQYASSEGAPFITECEEGNLHIEPLTGVFEVIDEEGRPAVTGDLVVTAFGTKGTPLVRYKIEDRVTLQEGKCPCGRNTQLVQSIDGRSNDYLFSPERGRINLGNVSNCVKGVKGIRQFQIVQPSTNRLEVNLVCSEEFTSEDRTTFLANLTDRVGDKMQIEDRQVNQIPREKSGKFRIVKNLLSANEQS